MLKILISKIGNYRMIKIQSVIVDEILNIRHQVLWPDKPVDFVRVEGDADGVHFGLFLDDLLVSVISLFPEDRHIRFRKFATIPAFQHKGLGTQLLQYAIDWAKTNAFETMWCDARSTALPFYTRFGFQRFSEAFFKGEVEYYKIEKRLK
jgi:GNAT superfamily N-acetyltransferase